MWARTQLRLSCISKDRNRGEKADHAKKMFQVVNEAFNVLSVPEKKAEYDGIFRMRCVLEQGSLTLARLREQPLDLGDPLAELRRDAETAASPALIPTPPPGRPPAVTASRNGQRGLEATPAASSPVGAERTWSTLSSATLTFAHSSCSRFLGMAMQSLSPQLMICCFCH